MLSPSDYLKNPCRTSSLPYWKTACVTIPENMVIVHSSAFDPPRYKNYSDQRYFRLLHDLRDLHPPGLPHGFSLSSAPAEEFAAHINTCYDRIRVAVDELRAGPEHPIYCGRFWIAVRDMETGQLAASAIGELDRTIHEGILEWVQVSPPYRRRGLGTYLVRELLCRMAGEAHFVTVSGQKDSPSNPEALYRACGFTGDDTWHILQMI